MAKLWLRVETYGKPDADTRAPFTPAQAKSLIDNGHEIFVEKAPHRVFPDSEYEQAGCKIMEPGSWYTAPEDAFILGIKYLPKEERFENQFPLPQKLIYFAHAWNGDDDGERSISRLEEGRDLYSHKPTPFYDLEDLVDHTGKRVAAFGYYAGYAGTLLSLHVWCLKEVGEKPPYRSPDPAIGKEAMVQKVRERLHEVEQRTGKKPTALVIAPNGRCGKGAVGLLKELDVKYTPWIREHTSNGHRFPEILTHDILLNCISFSPDNPKFITKSDLKKDMQLSVIGDISCYPGPDNPIDIYDDITSYHNLTHTIQTKNGCVEVIAVENLPRLLAREASIEYSSMFFPHIKALLDGADKDKDHTPIVWKRAAETSYKIIAGASTIKDLGMSISLHCFSQGYKLDTVEADRMLMQWLERNPLSITEKAGFSRFLADGSTQVYKIRTEGDDPTSRLRLSTMEQWADEIDIKSLCADTRIVAHHSLETEVEHFLRSTAGKMVMKNAGLRKAYMEILDAGHNVLNGHAGAREKMDLIVDDVAKLTETLSEDQLILEAFTSIRTLSSNPRILNR